MAAHVSPGDDLVASLPLKTDFHDRHEERSYARAKEIARRIVNDPSLVANAVRFLERHMRTDPHQARYYVLWRSILGMSPDEIARALLEDSDQGAELRGSAPVFVVLRVGAASLP